MLRWLKPTPRRDLSGRAHRSTARTRRPTCPLRVEVLEARDVPTAGALDPTFGTGGKVTTAIPGAFEAIASDVVVQPDGKIVTVGTTSDGVSWPDFALARYLPDGSLDPTFGNGGLVVTDLGGWEYFPKSALQPDGKILVVGATFDPDNNYIGNVALLRYLKDGRLDPSFGAGGTVITDFGGDDTGSDVAIHPNGTIVVVGSSYNPEASITDIGLARYKADGSLDTSFGSGGRVLTHLGVYDSGQSVVIRPNGKIVVGAQHYDANVPTTDFVLLQYNRSGSLDPSFGVGGVSITHFGSEDSDDVLTSIALQPDGKVVAAGAEENFATFTSEFLVARYNQDGTLDAGFGAGGYATTGFGGFDIAASVAIQPDGKIVAAGPYQGNDTGFALVRYTRDGSLDAAFGDGGKVTTAFDGFALNFGVALQPDGKIVTAGTSFDLDSFTLSIAVVRYEGHDAPSSSPSTAHSDAHSGAAAARGVPGAGVGSGIDSHAVDAFFSAQPSRKRLGWLN